MVLAGNKQPGMVASEILGVHCALCGLVWEQDLRMYLDVGKWEWKEMGFEDATFCVDVGVPTQYHDRYKCRSTP
jgi:hypothetical protein